MTVDRPLDGQVAVITGAASGIGQGIALELAKSGASVCILDLKPRRMVHDFLQRLESFDVKALYQEVDVRDRSGLEAAAAKMENVCGMADIVVSNAITSQRHELLHTPFGELQEAVEVGIYGTFHVLQVFARRMVVLSRPGSIVQVSSPWAHYPYAGGIDYRIVKSAQENMAMSLAVELMRQKIRVNTVEPGWVDTEGEHRWYSPEQMRAEGGRMPLGRLCTPEDIGRAVVYLCQEPYITGSRLKVDGGLALTYFEASSGPGTQGGSRSTPGGPPPPKV